MRRIALIIILVGMLGGLAIWWFQPTQVLKRRTRELLHTLTLPSDEAVANRRTGIYVLNGLLSSQVTFDAPPSLAQASGEFDRSEIESAYAWLCDQAKQSRCNLRQIHSISLHGDQADVEALIDALIELPDGRPADGRFECSFHWQLENESWHLTRAKWVEAGD